jgi:hypothetical protein
MACEEMQLFYAYLDAVEEAKKKAQPWECQVTVFPQTDEPAVETPVETAKSPVKKASVRNPTFPATLLNERTHHVHHRSRARWVEAEEILRH